MTAGSRLQRSGAGAARRKQSRLPATQPKGGSKAGEIVRLIDALVDGVGVRGRDRLGRRIATLLVDAYGGRGRALPRWVNDLVAFYAPRNGRRQAAGPYTWAPGVRRST